MCIVGDVNSEGRGKVAVLKRVGAHVLVDDRADICESALLHAGVVPYQRHGERYALFDPEKFARGRDWMKLLRARYGSLWLSNRPEHVAERNFGALINKIFREHESRQLAAKIQCARALLNNKAPDTPVTAVTAHPPPYPRRPAGQETS